MIAMVQGEVRRSAAVAHWVRSYRGRWFYREYPPLTTV